jgi:hypothetical protein
MITKRTRRMYEYGINLVESVTQALSMHRDKVLTAEFEKRGYTLDMLKNSDCWYNSYYDDNYCGDVYSYFVNGKCVLTVGYRQELTTENGVYKMIETMDILGGSEQC